MASDSVRRIMAEVKELSKLNNAPNTFFHAAPLESDLFEWHFTVRGPPDTPFEQGIYHGRILLPAQYPLKPPEIILLTPNGRFEVGKRICLSVTAHHQETWQPSWGIRTIITALVGFMPSRAEGVGALDYPEDDRRALARRSHRFRCERCGVCPAEQLRPRVMRKLGDGSKEEGDKTQDSDKSSTTAQPSSSDAQAHSETNPQPPPPPPPLPSRPVETETQTETRTEPTRPVSLPTATGTEQSGTQERELLYLAYAIAALMAAVIVRRVIKLLA